MQKQIYFRSADCVLGVPEIDKSVFFRIENEKNKQTNKKFTHTQIGLSWGPEKLIMDDFIQWKHGSMPLKTVANRPFLVNKEAD